MIRRAATAAGVAAVAFVVATAPGAQAAPPPVTTGATAYSAGASTGSANLAATLTLTGAVGGLLDGLIGPIVSSALDPLVSALQSTVNGTVAGVLGAGSANNAGAPAQQAAAPAGTFPNETFPDPCSAASATQPCYRTVNAAVNLPPLANVGAGAVRGFTQQTVVGDDPKNPVLGRAQAVGASVSVLPGIAALTSPLVGAAAVDAEARCPGDGSAPTASVSATNVTLLGGLVTLDVLNGAIAGLVVNGTSIGVLGTLSPITLASGITVRSYGSALRVDVPITLAQLLAGLGLAGSAVTELLGDVVATALTVSVVVGPNTSVSSTGAKAWGLGVGVDLSGSVRFDLLGLVGARVSLPTGLGGGNLGNVVDLRLAYASCSVGSPPGTGTSTPAVPPANV